MTNAICTVESCERPVRARGWCNTHYQRWRKAGDVDPDRPIGAPRKNQYGDPCSAPGCPNLIGRAGARGWCGTHLNRWQKHGDVQAHIPIQIRASVIRDSEKQCTRCHVFKPFGQFGKSARCNGGLENNCKACKNARSRKYYAENIGHMREKSRWAGRRSRFGIDKEMYEQLLAAQGGVCAICGDPPNGRLLSIDHDHSCCPSGKTCGACVRGILCHACNTGVGQFKDDPQRLEKAIAYLRR